jgi:hypothetical protein
MLIARSKKKHKLPSGEELSDEELKAMDETYHRTKIKK